MAGKAIIRKSIVGRRRKPAGLSFTYKFKQEVRQGYKPRKPSGALPSARLDPLKQWFLTCDPLYGFKDPFPDAT